MSSTRDRLELADEYDELVDEGTFEEHQIAKLLLEAAIKEVEARDLMLEAERIRREFVEKRYDKIKQELHERCNSVQEAGEEAEET